MSQSAESGATAVAEKPDMFRQLTELFETSSARYRMIPHPSEGRTDVASRLRRHPLEQAAKSVVLRVATGKRSRRYVLAVVPGDRRVDLTAVAARYDGLEASFAARDVAERLAGSVSGSIAPFAFSDELDLVVDHGLLRHDEIYFNAGRLDMSVALAVSDYLDMARPNVATIAADPPAEADREARLAAHKRVVGTFPTGIAVITSLRGNEPYGLSCQSFQSLSLEPPLVTFSVMHTSTSWPRIRRTGGFCINVLAADQDRLCRAFAVSGADKFEGVGWHHSPSGRPILDGALAWIDCDLDEEIVIGDHLLVVGRVRALDTVREAAPLVYFRGDFDIPR